MKRKLKIFKTIRRRKKKSKGKDEVAVIDFTDTQVKADELVGPSGEERRDGPEQERTVDPEEARRQRKNLAIQEMLSNTTYLETVTLSPNYKVTSKEEAERGIFACMCGDLDNACGEDIDEPMDIERSTRTYKIVKQSPREKIGLSFVAFKQQEGIFVCKIKEGSKFKATGLQIGMRVVSINGEPCPERVGTLMKMLKKVEKELVLEVDNIGNPNNKVETTVPRGEELKTSSKEVIAPTREGETREPEAETPNKDVGVSKQEVTTNIERVDSTEPRLYNSDGYEVEASKQEVTTNNERVDSTEPRLYNSDGYAVDASKQEMTTNIERVDSPERRLYSSDSGIDDDSDQESNSQEEESKEDKYKRKYYQMKRRMDLMKKRGTISFLPNRKNPYAVSKDSEDTDGTASSGTVSSASEEKIKILTSDSESSESSGTFWTNESLRQGHMARFTKMMDGLVGADKDRLGQKKGQGFTMSEVAKKIQEGAPIWIFFE